jgi:cytochrome c oxidase subunit 2
MVAIWVAVTTIGVLGALYVVPWLMPESASDTMHLSVVTMVVFSVAAAPVAGLVYAVLVYGIMRWRYRGEGVPPDGPPLRANNATTTLWLVGSTVLTIFVLVWGLTLLANDQSGEAKAEMTVDVTGQQWVWNFSYPGTEVKSHELYLPVDTEILFKVTSEDVVHGFWIPQMGIKINANPSATTTTSVLPNKVGVFDVRCTEICGLNHAVMVTRVHVLTKNDFEKWLASQPASI